jgi:DNA polymerase III epsilon subunit-like protein
MIVVDIETSGLDFNKCGIWQIGAVELENPSNTFLEESRIDDEDQIIDEGDEKVLELIGKTEEQLRDKNKQSQKELLENFFKWVEKIKIKNFVCHHPGFDLAFIEIKARGYGLNLPHPHKAFDLHTLAQTKFFEINDKFLIKENKSDLGLTNILSFVGMKDERGTHNGLEDAKLEAECFSRLIFGKNLLPEFAEFKIPENLKK